MKSIILNSFIVVLLCTLGFTNSFGQSLSKKEKKEGWQLLFDGKNGNSGIIIFVHEGSQFKYTWETGPEM